MPSFWIVNITADIYLNDVSDPDWMSKNPNEWVYGTLGDKDTNIGNNNMFSGKLDGDGHVIHGIYINESAKRASGLFIRLNQNAKVEKLGIAHSYIKAISDTEGTNAHAGALAGIVNYHKDDGVVISQCFADETVTVKNGLIFKSNL